MVSIFLVRANIPRIGGFQITNVEIGRLQYVTQFVPELSLKDIPAFCN